MTPQERKVFELALEALEVASSCIDGYYIPKGKTHLPEVEQAITAIKEALAQPEQEPVAWRYGALLYWDKLDALEFMRTSNDGYQLEPLYTTPQPDKLAYYEKVADDLQALCDKQSLRIAELEAQPEQEPVAVTLWEKGIGTTLNTTPPQRTWVGLTDEEKNSLWDRAEKRQAYQGVPALMALIQEVEAKLKEKNI